MINLNINFYLDENYLLLLPISIYTHCKMRCHYVEKRIYLIQTRYVLLQHACQKLAKHVIMLIFCHLSFFTHQTKVGKLGNKWGIIPQKLGKRKVDAPIMNERRNTQQ